MNEDPFALDPLTLKGVRHPCDRPLRRALLAQGVDIPGGKQAWVCAAHGDRELSDTEAALDRALGMLKDEKLL